MTSAMAVFTSMRLSTLVSVLALWLHSTQGFAFHVPLARCQQQRGLSFGRTPAKQCELPLIVGSMSIDDDADDDSGIESDGLNGLTEPSVDSNGMNEVNPATKDRPSKSDLYSQDELFNILQIHQKLQDSLPTPEVEENPIISQSLHDMILQTVSEIDDAKEDDAAGDGTGSDEETNGKVLFNYEVNQRIRDSIPSIRAIACDIDGTLLSAEHVLHPRTRDAVKRAVEAASSSTETLQYFFPATGKSRAGAFASLGTEISTILSNVPGVFCQGLYCVDAQGKVVFERKLTREQVDAVEQLAQHYEVSLIAYDGDNLYATKSSDPKHVAEVHEKWGENRPTVIELADHEPGFHKILLMDDDTKKLHSIVRPPLEGLMNAYEAEVTQSVPTMLEVLPKGCSKAQGVKELCKLLGIDPSTQLLAMGDAENDIGMLKLAAIGVAVGNAIPMVKGAADIVMTETNCEGAAGAAIEKFGFGEGLDQ